MQVRKQQLELNNGVVPIGKGGRQGCLSSPCLFNFYAVLLFSHQVMSDSSQPHGLQHTKLLCPSPSPRVYPSSCPLHQRCHPAVSSTVVPSSSCPQSLPASVFSNESTLHMRWPKFWSFSFNIIPSKEIPGLISFRMDGLDLLSVQGTLKSLLQHHSPKNPFFRVSFLYSDYWKHHT